MRWWTILFAGIFSLAPRAAGAAGDDPVTGWLLPLDGYPLCEASAALAVPCSSDPERSCVWIADNEDAGQIFEYARDARGLLEKSPTWTIRLEGAAVGDAEALARSGDSVLVFGSHSRRSDCTRAKKRLRVARVPLGAGPRPEATLVARSGEGDWASRLADCTSELLPVAGDGAPADLARRVCAAIRAAEEAADAASGKEDCPGEAFNIEGAASIPAPRDGGGRESRVWLGLRGPLVDGKAVLLRVAPLDASSGRLAFDGVALLDLRGHGIRELAPDGGWLWGISGTVRDSTEPSRLFRVALASIENGATLWDAQFSNQTLPPSAEGLVLEPGARRALVVVDGGTDDEARRCDPVAQQLLLPVD